MRTSAEIRAELVLVNAAIAKILGGGVEEFQLEGGERARMVQLGELRKHREALQQELVRVTRVPRSRFIRAQRY